MIDFGVVHPGQTLYIPFASYAGATGASVTLTGLATSDVEIFKDGSTTQRASDSGYALLDTDGIDVDGITGLHGFSIDLADNATAGFYASGSQYWVVVSSVTIDSQTVTFIAATFRIGYPSAVLNTTIATLSSQTSFTLTTGPAEDDALNGMWAVVHDVASAVQKARVLILDYAGSTKTVTLAAGATFTAAATDNFSVMDLAPLQPATTGRTAVVDSAGLVDATAVKLGPSGSGTAQTARDVGASVLLSVGTGTGQLSFASGVVNANVEQWLAVPVTADDDVPRVSIAGDTVNATVAGVISGAITRASLAADTGLQSVRSNTAQAGGATSVTLDASASSTTDYYKHCLLCLTGGTGVGQARLVTAYNGTTKVATVTPAWATNPDNTSTFAVLPAGLTDVEAFGGAAGTFASGRPDVNTTHAAGTAWGSGAITAGAIATDAITAAKIADGAIDAATFAAGAVTASAIASDAITAAKLAADCITAAKVATGAIDADALAADAANEIADALLDRSAGVETNRTVRQSLRLMLAALVGKLSGAATTTVTVRDTNDGVDRVVAVVDSDGNRSSVTLDAS